MNAAATDNGPDDSSRQSALFAEIAELKRQRDDLVRKLAACEAEVRRLRGDA